MGLLNEEGLAHFMGVIKEKINGSLQVSDFPANSYMSVMTPEGAQTVAATITYNKSPLPITLQSKGEGSWKFSSGQTFTHAITDAAFSITPLKSAFLSAPYTGLVNGDISVSVKTLPTNEVKGTFACGVSDEWAEGVKMAIDGITNIRNVSYEKATGKLSFNADIALKITLLCTTNNADTACVRSLSSGQTFSYKPVFNVTIDPMVETVVKIGEPYSS